MASPNSTTTQWDTLYTSTWYNIIGKSPTDNFFDKYPLLEMMSKKGKIKHETGGTRFDINLEYDENGTVTSIGKGGTISLAKADPITKATYDWKYIVGNTTRYWADEKMNAGKSKIIDMASTEMGNLKKSINKYANSCLHGDGTGNGGLDPLGLQALIAEDPTASSTTVGGINQSSYSWWRNQITDMSTLALSVNLVKKMDNMINNCTYNGDMPDIIITDQGSYEDYAEETLEKMSIVNKILGDAGVQQLNFRGLPLTWDRDNLANSMYFINTDFMYIVTNSDQEFELTDWKTATNNLDKVAQAVWCGQFAVSQRRCHGVLFDIGETT